MTASPRRRRRRAAFTLVEVLLVLVILVIIGSLVVGNYVRIQRNAEMNAAKAQVDAFKTPLSTFRLDVGDFPSTSQGLDALVAPPSDLRDQTKWRGPYLDGNVPLDPWGQPYQYEYPGRHREDMPDIWSLGPDGQDSSGDEVGNWMEA
jgi:general secretion pathway protein G